MFETPRLLAEGADAGICGGLTLVRPATAAVGMVPGEPDLSEVGREFVVGQALPDSRREGRPVFVQRKGLEGVFNRLGNARVVELICARRSAGSHGGHLTDLFSVGAMKPQLLEPFHLRDAEATHGIPYGCQRLA